MKPWFFLYRYRYFLFFFDLHIMMALLQELLNLLKLHKDKLERYCSIINLQREIETLAITIKHLQSGTVLTAAGCLSQR